MSSTVRWLCVERALHARCMRVACALHARCMRVACALHARFMRASCAGHSFRGLATRCAFVWLFNMCALCALCVRSVCALCALCVRSVCALCALCVRSVCALCPLCVRSVCALYTHSALAIRCACVVNSLASPKFWQKLDAQRRTGLICHFSMRGPCVAYVWLGLYARICVNAFTQKGLRTTAYGFSAADRWKYVTFGRKCNFFRKIAQYDANAGNPDKQYFWPPALFLLYLSLSLGRFQVKSVTQTPDHLKF